VQLATSFMWLLLCRYLRRGLNDKGRVANDVETEQIVFEDVPEGLPVQICSVVQNRGSIPLFWSQETSRLNLKPDIICMPYHFLNTSTFRVMFFLSSLPHLMYEALSVCLCFHLVFVSVKERSELSSHQTSL